MTACSETSIGEVGPEHVLGTARQGDLVVELTARAATSQRSAGFAPAGRWFGWFGAETTCSVAYSVRADTGDGRGARTIESGSAPVPPATDCEAAAKALAVELCEERGRVAYHIDGTSFRTVFLRGKARYEGTVFLGAGGACTSALGPGWDDATYLAHSQAVGACTTLLESAAARATVECFLDYRSFGVGTSLAKPSIADLVARPGPDQPGDEPYVRFMRAVALGAERSVDLERGLYDLLADRGPTPWAVDWTPETTQRALSVAPSRARRVAYVDRAIGQCPALADDVFRRDALAEALAQLHDADRTRRAESACPGLRVPAEPVYPAALR